MCLIWNTIISFTWLLPSTLWSKCRHVIYPLIRGRRLGVLPVSRSCLSSLYSAVIRFHFLKPLRPSFTCISPGHYFVKDPVSLVIYFSPQLLGYHSSFQSNVLILVIADEKYSQVWILRILSGTCPVEILGGVDCASLSFNQSRWGLKW